MEIRKIMDREDAVKLLDEWKLKVCGIDLEKICSNDELIENVKEETPQKIAGKEAQRTLENAVMTGLVSWSEEKNCISQRLIFPLKSGEQSCEVINYVNEINLNQSKHIEKSGNSASVLIDFISLMSGRSKPLIGTMKSTDINISAAIINFFDL